MALPTGLRAFRHADFRRFFAAQFVAQVGSWMQTVAQSWLVLQLTSSPLLLGLIGTLQFGPILLFSIVSGAVADRVRKRRLLVVTQSVLGGQALLLGALVYAGHVEYWHVAVLATGVGFANVLDGPARQSFVAEMVGRADVGSAISLNSACFNSARIVGPSIGGLIIGRYGIAPAFALNALGFAIAITMMLTLRARGPARPLMFTAGALACCGLVGLAFVRSFWPAVAMLFITGFFGIISVVSCNATMQLAAPDALRGRVMSIYTLIWGGVFPIGAFMVGAMSERWGVQRALMTNGSLGLAGVAALLGWWRLRAR